MPEVLASTCGTLLSSQGSDAHHTETLSGRFWGNPSNLLPWTHLVNSPRGLVSKSEGITIVPLIGRASDRSFGAMGCCLWFARWPSSVLRERFRRWQQGRDYGEVTGKSNHANLGRVALKSLVNVAAIIRRALLSL
jgi:hypothetical protein